MAILKEQEASQPTPKRWSIELLKAIEQKLASFVEPYDAEKEARRTKSLVRWGVGVTAAAAIVATATGGAPFLNDYLRESGTLDPTTPVMRGFNSPNRVVTSSDFGTKRFVELDNPYDVAAAGKAAIINDTPGLRIKINSELVAAFTSNDTHFTNIPGDQRLHSFLVPYFLDGRSPTDSRPADFVRSEEKRILKSDVPIATGTDKAFPYVISVDDELEKLNPYFDGLGANITKLPLYVSLFPLGGGGGGPSVLDRLGYALSKKWLKRVIELSNQSPQRLGAILDPEAGAEERINSLGLPITVTSIDKSVFDQRRVKRGKTPYLGAIPSTSSNATTNTDSCFVAVLGATSPKSPADVEFTLGANFTSNSGDVHIAAGQWDFNNDGNPDTPFDSKHQGIQRHTYRQRGAHTVTAQVRLNNGNILSCSNSFTLE